VIQAERNGTTLQAAVKSYPALETALRSNFIDGIAQICAMFQIPPIFLAQKIAEAFGQAEPAPPPGPAAVAEATIANFRADPRNEFMPIVENTMRELLLGEQAQSLHEAYDLACAMNTHVQEITMNRIRPRPAVPRSPLEAARMAAKHISGAPSTAPKPPSHDSSGSPYDDVRAAVARQRGN
jgi:hypothetical protein